MFLQLSGDFSANQDKKTGLNPDFYHLMNSTGQRASMQDFLTNGRPKLPNYGKKKVSNPYYRPEMNSAIQKNYPVMTPKMAMCSR